MIEEAIFEELLELLERRDFRTLKQKLSELHEADVAEFIEEHSPIRLQSFSAYCLSHKLLRSSV